MNLPTYFPTWMVLYFGTAGSIGLSLVALVFWTWMKTTRLSDGHVRSSLRWNIVGYVFLFSANWFACGIGGGPGNMLSSDPSMYQPMLATYAAVLAMLCSLPGWGCILIGQRVMLKGLEQGSTGKSPVVGGRLVRQD